MLHPHDDRQAVLPCDHRAVGQAAHLRHQALDRDEQGRLTGGRRDQDVARFEVCLRHVQDDAGPFLEQRLFVDDVLRLLPAIDEGPDPSDLVPLKIAKVVASD
jgi:hypothetical protein